MKIFSAPRATLAFGAMMCVASCRCDDTFQCPAFDPSVAMYALPASGDSLFFRNGAGVRIAFGAAAPVLSPTYPATTKQNLFGGCDVEECDARASSDATSAAVRNGTSALSLQYMTSSDARSGARYETYSSGAVFDFRFALNETFVDNSGDTTLYAFTLGPHTYDTVLVRRRDTTATRPDSLAIWRVFTHRPEGVIGFDDRQTGSLFYRE